MDPSNRGRERKGREEKGDLPQLAAGATCEDASPGSPADTEPMQCAWGCCREQPHKTQYPPLREHLQLSHHISHRVPAPRRTRCNPASALKFRPSNKSSRRYGSSHPCQEVTAINYPHPTPRGGAPQQGLADSDGSGPYGPSHSLAPCLLHPSRPAPSFVFHWVGEREIPKLWESLKVRNLGEICLLKTRLLFHHSWQHHTAVVSGSTPLAVHADSSHLQKDLAETRCRDALMEPQLSPDLGTPHHFTHLFLGSKHYGAPRFPSNREATNQEVQS